MTVSISSGSTEGGSGYREGDETKRRPRFRKNRKRTGTKGQKHTRVGLGRSSPFPADMWRRSGSAGVQVRLLPLRVHGFGAWRPCRGRPSGRRGRRRRHVGVDPRWLLLLLYSSCDLDRVSANGSCTQRTSMRGKWRAYTGGCAGGCCPGCSTPPVVCRKYLPGAGHSPKPWPSSPFCRHSGNGGPQTWLPAAHGVAKPAGPTAHLPPQDNQGPREGPSLAR